MTKDVEMLMAAMFESSDADCEGSEEVRYPDDLLVQAITDIEFAHQIASVLGEQIQGMEEEAIAAVGKLDENTVKLLLKTEFDC